MLSLKLTTLLFTSSLTPSTFNALSHITLPFTLLFGVSSTFNCHTILEKEFKGWREKGKPAINKIIDNFYLSYFYAPFSLRNNLLTSLKNCEQHWGQWLSIFHSCYTLLLQSHFIPPWFKNKWMYYCDRLFTLVFLWNNPIWVD